MNPDFSNQLTTTIRRIADIEWIAGQEIQDWQMKVMKNKGSGFIIDIHKLINSEPLMTLSWELLSPFGFNQSQVGNIISCLRNKSGNESSKIFLTASWRLVINRQQLIIQPLKEITPGEKFFIQDFKKRKSMKTPIPLVFIKHEQPSSYEIPISKMVASLDGDKISFPLCLRKWEPGDVFYPYGLNRKKKLSDFFIDQKLSLPEKETCWLLCSEKKILWIIGHRIDHRFRITPKTKRILIVMTTETPDI
jgi:tRNA(Ile)-lysidine synthase